MKQKELVPKRRFQGFTDEWNSKKMKELASFSKGRGYSKGDLVSYGNPIILYGQLYTNYQSHIQSVKTYATRKENSVISQGNEVIVPSSGETAEDIARASAVALSGIILAGDLNIIKPNSILDSLFLGLNISNGSVNKELIKRVQGSSVVHLYNSDIEEVNLSYPSMKEQQKIGNFFKHLDQMISLEQHKLEKTKAMKSAYLAEMFPAEGEQVPKRRFAGFTGEWKETNLQDICSVFKDGDWIESKDQSKNGYRLIQTGNIGITEFIEKPNNKKWVSEETFKSLNCNEVFSGDILISRLPEPAGRACIIPKLKTKMITSVDCTIIRTLENYSADFLVQYLCTEKYFKEVTNLLGGGTRQRISRGALSIIKVSSPNSLLEQEAIGEFFRNLDDSIIIQKKKLDKLKAMKKAYLEEMFV